MENKRMWRKRYLKTHPWAKTLNRILTRCNGKNQKYHKKGIRNFLTLRDLKFLWFRDRAYLMERPSIAGMVHCPLIQALKIIHRLFPKI